MDYDNLTKGQVKKLKSIEQRLLRVNKDIREMGFTVYLANDMVNIMDGPAHDDSKYHTPAIYENVRHCFRLEGWDGGDW